MLYLIHGKERKSARNQEVNMKETYINFINKKDHTDIFTCLVDSNQEIIRLLKIYIPQGYDFEIYNPL